MIEILWLLLALSLPAGALCGIVALTRVQRLSRRVSDLEQQLRAAVPPDAGQQQARDPGAGPDRAAATGNAAPTPGVDSRAAPPVAPELSGSGTPEPSADAVSASALSSRETPGPESAPDSAIAHGGPPGAPEPAPASPFGRLAAHLRDHWMVWLGGFCVAMAGVYLARYAAEQGMLGPGARVGLGLATGVALHGAAEWLRRRTGSPQPAFAALAGGGSITLFAVLLASMRLYDLLSPGTAFALLAAVAFVTMWLAYLHGPVLAAIGIVGAYLVPLLVSSGQGQILIALLYALLVSASALLLMRYVYRHWLWWGFLAGALGWWLISLGDGGAEAWRGWYLAALGYLALSLPDFDGLLRKSVALPVERFSLRMYRGLEPHRERMYPILAVLLILAQCLSLLASDSITTALWRFSPLPLLLLLAARHRESLNFAPTLALAGTCVTWLLARLGPDGLRPFESPQDKQFLVYLGGTALLYVIFALRNFAGCRFRGIWSCLATMAPVALMALGYLLTAGDAVSWYWGFAALLVAVLYLGLAGAVLRREFADTLLLWLFFGGHFALSLAAVALLEPAGLTLAIAAQSVSAAWLIERFRSPQLGWVLKLIVALVLLRLSLNPWLWSYPTDQHWSLWTYGGATACTLLATWLLRRRPALARWTEGATLHLFVLSCWTELRYWVHDGALFTGGLDFLECALYLPLFGILAVVYYRRSLVSGHLGRLYRYYAYALSALATLSYLVILGAVLGSDAWITESIGPRPILNATQLAFGVPVLVALAHVLFHDRRLRRPALGFTGLALWVYLSLQVRHLFQGSISLQPAATNAELYSYSALWLVMALATLLAGAWRLGAGTYRAGLLLLALVIGKLFLVDMGGLEGLYRVASFMGLGLALLGLSWLHQRIKTQSPAVRSTIGGTEA